VPLDIFRNALPAGQAESAVRRAKRRARRGHRHGSPAPVPDDAARLRKARRRAGFSTRLRRDRGDATRLWAAGGYWVETYGKCPDADTLAPVWKRRAIAATVDYAATLPFARPQESCWSASRPVAGGRDRL